MVKQAKRKIILGLCLVVLSLTAFQSVGKATASYRGGTSVYDDITGLNDYIWSPDGKRIAYINGTDRWDNQLWVADKAGFSTKLKNRQLIFTGVLSGVLLDWQGDWILFNFENEEWYNIPYPGKFPSAYNGIRELWKIKYDGTELTQVTYTYSNGIYPNSGRNDNWYENVGTVAGGYFLPGTDLVVFSAHSGNGWYRLYTCTNDSSNPMWYNYLGGYAFTWAMSPTGNKVTYGDASYWNDPTRLYSCNIDGSGDTLLKVMPHRSPHFILADGYTIIYRYVSRPAVPAEREGNIYAINMDGTNDRTVLDDDIYLNYPENYHPVDGQAMLMRSNRGSDGNYHIFNLNVTDPVTEASIVQLTDGPYNDDMAMYSPDARYLMYRRLPDTFDTAANNPPYPYELVIKRIFAFPTPGFSFMSIFFIIPVIILMKRRKKT